MNILIKTLTENQIENARKYVNGKQGSNKAEGVILGGDYSGFLVIPSDNSRTLLLDLHKYQFHLVFDIRSLEGSSRRTLTPILDKKFMNNLAKNLEEKTVNTLTVLKLTGQTINPSTGNNALSILKSFISKHDDVYTHINGDTIYSKDLTKEYNLKSFISSTVYSLPLLVSKLSLPINKSNIDELIRQSRDKELYMDNTNPRQEHKDLLDLSLRDVIKLIEHKDVAYDSFHIDKDRCIAIGRNMSDNKIFKDINGFIKFCYNEISNPDVEYKDIKELLK